MRTLPFVPDARTLSHGSSVLTLQTPLGCSICWSAPDGAPPYETLDAQSRAD